MLIPRIAKALFKLVILINVLGVTSAWIPVHAQEFSEKWGAKRAELLAEIDHSKVRVSSLQEKIGPDVNDLANFVRNYIQFEPYIGVLRGSVGTLWAKAGNSLDRSLLLAEMLNHAGHKTRLARVNLSAIQAERVLRSLVQANDNVFFDEDLIARAAVQFVLITNALHDAGIDETGHQDRTWRDAINATRDHFLVQVYVNNRWTNLETVPNVPIVEEPVIMSFPPVELNHRVTFELIVPQQDSTGEVSNETVLRSTYTSAELAERVVGLTHEIDGRTARALLYIGSETLESKSFSVPKLPVSSSKSNPWAGLANSMGGIPSTIGDATESAKRASPGDPQFFSEYLKVTVAGPSRARVTTHTVYETSEARDVHVALNSVKGIVISSGHLPSDFVLSILGRITDPEETSGVIHQLYVIGSIYSVLREYLPTSYFGHSVSRVISAPNITVITAESYSDSLAIKIDLTHKAYTLLSGDPLARKDQYYDMIANGVLDHELERQLLTEEGFGESVGALIEAAAIEDIPLSVLRDVGEVPLYLSHQGRRRAEEALANERIVIIPSTQPSSWATSVLGWWEINPYTGFAEDVAENGTHGFIEKTINLGQYTFRVGRSILCIALVATGSTAVQLGEGMVATGDVRGASLIVMGGGVEAVGSLGCGSSIRNMTPTRKFPPRIMLVNKPKTPIFKPPPVKSPIIKSPRKISSNNPRVGGRKAFQRKRKQKN